MFVISYSLAWGIGFGGEMEWSAAPATSIQQHSMTQTPDTPLFKHSYTGSG